MIDRLVSGWYKTPLPKLNCLLLPASKGYEAVMRLRRWLYGRGWLNVKTFNQPVIVVGNLTVGGSGKTPMVIWLVNTLRQMGFYPGVVSRGYGGLLKGPIKVLKTHSAQEVGDEPLLIAKRCAETPVVVDQCRPRAAAYALTRLGADCIVADDGLQHYPLGRAMEIALINERVGLGNKCCLPAGPLREPIERLNAVDFVVHSHGDQLKPHYQLHFEAGELKPLHHELKQLTPKPPATVHAVAGIASPDGFFDELKARGYNVIPHAFRDHYYFKYNDLNFDDGYPVIMTEKDAMRCQTPFDSRLWYLPIQAKLTGGFRESFKAKFIRISEKEGLLD